jgi:hypothetical protein
MPANSAVALLGVSPAGMRFVFAARLDAPPLWNGPAPASHRKLGSLQRAALLACRDTRYLEQWLHLDAQYPLVEHHRRCEQFGSPGIHRDLGA